MPNFDRRFLKRKGRVDPSVDLEFWTRQACSKARMTLAGSAAYGPRATDWNFARIDSLKDRLARETSQRSASSSVRIESCCCGEHQSVEAPAGDQNDRVRTLSATASAAALAY